MLARRVIATLVSLVLGLLALGVGPAAATTSGEIAEFEIPGICDPPVLGAPRTEGVLLRLCENPESESGELPRGSTLATVLPGGQVTKRAVPKAGGGPIAVAPDGTIWVAANVPEFGSGPAIVDRISPKGDVRRFQLSGRPGSDAPHVVGLAVGADGAVWATVGTGVRVGVLVIGGSRGGKLVRIGADGTVTDFPLPHQIEPLAVVEAPDGNLWFTAVRDRLYEEHIYRPGTAYVGRITPGGQLSFYPAPHQDGALTALAVAKDGGLLVGGPELRGIDAVGLDGQFGRRYGLGPDHVSGLAVGADGDVWIAAERIFGEKSLIRMTPRGQRTWFDFKPDAVAAAAEGDIWAASETSVARIVPGAPGLDVRELQISRPSRTAAVRLACGGSTAACGGNLTLALTFHSRSRQPDGKVKWTRHLLPIGALSYAVGAESEATVTFDLPARALALSGRPLLKVRALRAQVIATVAGGPTIERALGAPALAPPH
jgi:streptogramin lyase